MNAPTQTGIALRGGYITLDALLKATGLVASGGHAKALITSGQVSVNGEAETRRGRKLRAGDVVVLDGQRILVAAPAAAVAGDEPGSAS